MHSDGEVVSGKRRWKRVLQLFFWLAAVLPLVWVILRRSSEIVEQLQSVSPVQLAVPIIMLVAVFPLMSLNSYTSLRYIGARFSVIEAAGFYFGSQGPKYLPGGFWAFPSRMVFYQSKGIRGAYAILSVFREVAALFLGAAFVSAIGALTGTITPEVKLAVLAGAGISAAGILLTSYSWFWKLVSRLPLGISLPFEDLIHDGDTRSLRWLPMTFAVSGLFWLLLGIPFRSLILAIEPAASINWLQAAAVFAMAWCGGFVVVVLPAGLGVRETLLTVVLTQFMPESRALTIALSARLWWMIAEAVYIVISLYWLIRTTRLGPVLYGIRKRLKTVSDAGGEHEENS